MMFRALLFSLLYLSVALANAQNWSPVTAGVKYYYSTNYTSIERELWVDSTTTENGQTVFHLNRFMQPCDTCYQMPKPPGASFDSYCGEYACYVLVNQPSRLNRKVVVDGKVFTMKDPDNWILLTYANLGDDWIADTLSGLTAEVTDVSFQYIPVLNISDSVKTIELSDHRAIMLSKNFGVIDFLEEKLVGYENDTQKLGHTPLSFEEIFGFKVGDVFEYECSDYQMKKDYKRVKVNSAAFQNDTLIVNVSGNIRHFKNVSTTYPPVYIINDLDTISEKWTFVNNKNNPAICPISKGVPVNLYSEYSPNTSVKFKDNWSEAEIQRIFAQNILVKAKKANGQGMYSPYNGSDEVYELISQSTDPIYYDYTFQKRIGKLYFEECAGSGGCYYEQLVAYRLADGTESGVFSPDWLFTDRETTLETLPAFSLSPNPARETLRLQSPAAGQKTVEILNLQGQILYQTETNNAVTDISLENLPKGLYLVRVSQNSQTTTQRFIKE